ncbi:MAG TPA: hypothetical protein VKT73_15435 [Xanthobacteraceae bacterium]|nr:hypothetical protein [Xanthobacteraceae bacterium]
MTWADLTNGIFEFGIAYFLWRGVMMLRQSKKVQGFYWPTIAWTTAWGLWNLYYYPSLGQWLSFTGGAIVVSVNIAWLGHVWHYWWLENYEKTVNGNWRKKII